MTNRQPIPTDALLVALDIAKVRNEVLIEASNHKRRRRLSVLNTRAEHDRLIETLRAYGKPVICAFEATGNYHRPIAWRLIEAGFDVRLVSSMALARTREALHNGWDKNDPRDAQVILHMLRIGATQRYHDPLRAGINDVQELSKTHEAIAKAKTEIQHRILTHYLPLYFPEIERFRGNSRSDWFFAFLDAFPTPASIMALSKGAFIEAAWDVVGRKVSKERLLADIYEAARTSIGLPLPIDAPAIRMFRMVIAEARSLIRQRNEIEDMADAMLRDSADYKALRKVPGIGPVIALTTGRRDYQSSVMPACAERSGSPDRSRSASGRTDFGTNSSATSPKIGTIRISDARRSPLLPPRWLASYTRSSKAVPITGPSSKGGYQVEESLSAEP